MSFAYLPLVYFAVRLFKRKASNTIVLTGLSGSGKTVLFYQVRHNHNSGSLPAIYSMQKRVERPIMNFVVFNPMVMTWFDLSQLRDGSSHQGTVTSMEPNEGSFVLHSETTKVKYITLVCRDM